MRRNVSSLLFRPLTIGLLCTFCGWFGCATPAFASGYTVSGTVMLDSNALPDGENITLTFVQSNGNLTSRHALLDSSGAFTVADIPNGTYTLWVKGRKWLAAFANNGTAITVNSGSVTGVSVLLPGGDANDDNYVDIGDFGILVNAYGGNATVPGSGYDERADFDGSGRIDIGDFGILVNNFGRGAVISQANQPAFDPAHSVIHDFPAPDYADEVVPRDAADAGSDGPSAADAVNLTSGVYENVPGADIAARNPLGVDPAYSRSYHSGRASQHYASPGLPEGWTDNYDYAIQPLNATLSSPLMLAYPNGALEPLKPQSNGSGSVVLDADGNCTLTPLPKRPYLAQAHANGQGSWDSVTLTFSDNSKMMFTVPAGGTVNVFRLSQLVNTVSAQVLTLNRDAQGCLQTISNGNQTLLQCDYAGGLLKKVTDVPGQRRIWYGYDSANRLHTVSKITAIAEAEPLPAAAQWQYTYTVLHGWNLMETVSVPDPSQIFNFSSNLVRYDTGGRVSELHDAHDALHKYTYGDNATTINILDSSSPRQTVLTWRQRYRGNRDTGFDDPRYNSTVIDYSDFANPYLATQYTDRNGIATQFTYDALGNLQTLTEPVNDHTVTTTFGYDTGTNALGQINEITETASTNVAKTSTQFIYYGGNAQVGNVPQASGLLKSVLTPKPGTSGTGERVETDFVYTALGNIAAIYTPAPAATGTLTYTFQYGANEAVGEPISVTAPPVGMDTFVTQFAYDAVGNVSAITDPAGRRTDFKYNLADQLLAVFDPPTNSTVDTRRTATWIDYAYPGGPVTQSALYAPDNVTSLSARPPASVTPLRQLFSTYYSEGEAKGISGSTPPVQWSYDPLYRLSSLSYASGNQSAASTFAYDDANNTLTHTWPRGKSVKLWFDKEDNPKQFATSRMMQQGNSTVYTMKPDLFRVDTVTFPTGSDVSNIAYDYDAFGRVKQVTNAVAQLNYAYDDAGNLTQATTQYLDTNAPTQRMDYAYFPDGSLQESACWYRSTASEMPVWLQREGHHYSYDEALRCTHIAHDIPLEEQTVTSHQIFTYDKEGRILTEKTDVLKKGIRYGDVFGSGTLPTFIQYTPFDNGPTLFDFTLQHDPLDKLKDIAYNNVLVPSFSKTQHFDYDLLDRMTTDTTTTGGVSDIRSFVSDGANNLTTLRGQTFTYNADNQISNAGFVHDDDGNLTHIPASVGNSTVHTYTYDDLARLKSYHDATHDFTFGYRPDGLRAWKEDNAGHRAYFFYDGDTLHNETDAAGTMTRSFLWGASGLLQSWTPQEGLIDYAFDTQGSVTARHIHGEDGSTQAQWDEVRQYDAWGQKQRFQTLPIPTSTGPTFPDPVGFGGQWGYYTDAETTASGVPGLILCTHRYYNPDLARWLTRDPIGYDGGINVYAYCENDPAGLVDPSGLEAVTVLTVEEAAKAGYVWVQGHSMAVAGGTVYEGAALTQIGATVAAGTATATAATVGGIVLIGAGGAYVAYHLSGKYLVPLVGNGEMELAADPETTLALKAMQFKLLNARARIRMYTPATQAASGRGNFTAAGHALSKHGNRAGSVLPRISGNTNQINSAAGKVVESILGDPNSIYRRRHHARYGNVIEIVAPNNQGLRFQVTGTKSSDLKFVGFIE